MLEAWLEYIIKLYEYRRMPEARKQLKGLFNVLGGPEEGKKTQPILSLLHAQITGALGALKHKTKTGAKSLKQGTQMAASFKKNVAKWKDLMDDPLPQTYYAALRSYHVLVSIQLNC
jgi:hypothetical protein